MICYRLLSLAAGQGYGWAQYYLGGLFFEGNGTDKNLIDAIVWFKKAGDHGIRQAQEALQTLGKSCRWKSRAGSLEAMLFLVAAAGKTYPDVATADQG